MEYHKIADSPVVGMSESEEMYLVSLALLLEAGIQAPVPVSQLAQQLSIQPVSANQMVRKLEDMGWVIYEPYKGVSFTPEGQRRALSVLRRRRLWEVFLAESLRVAPAEAGELACRLEHTLPAEVAERLADFLGDPASSPQGKLIPRLDPADASRGGLLLSRLRPGEGGRIEAIDADPSTRLFLGREGLLPGAEATVLGVGKEGAVLVDVDGGPVYLAPGLANLIWVDFV